MSRRVGHEGASLHTGDRAIERSSEGAFMQPAVLAGVTQGMDAYAEEIFGPVAVIHGVDSEDEAVALANDVAFGLSGSGWGTDLERAHGLAKRLDVGMAYVNEQGTTLPGPLFSGVRRSGVGRELGRWSMGEFVTVRLRRASAG